MGLIMEDISFNSPEVLCPELFDMDQCPLPGAEAEMLQSGELKKILLGINYPILLQVTPSGRYASSTVTT